MLLKDSYSIQKPCTFKFKKNYVSHKILITPKSDRFYAFLPKFMLKTKHKRQIYF